MHFNICDFRKNREKHPIDFIQLFFENNLWSEVILLGHSKDGKDLYGVTANNIIPNEGVYLIWLYCCHSANDLCLKLASKGYLTIGYIRKIFTFKNRKPLEVEYVEKNIDSLKDKKIDVVETMLKQNMYECARNEIKKREFLLAAILNYNRLSMKAFQ